MFLLLNTYHITARKSYKSIDHKILLLKTFKIVNDVMVTAI